MNVGDGKYKGGNHDSRVSFLTNGPDSSSNKRHKKRVCDDNG